jgi:hypothetical protein
MRSDFAPELAAGKLRTDHPVLEPVSAYAGNGNFLRRDRPAKGGSSPSRDRFRDARKPRFPRTNCEIACEGLNPKTGWWCAQSYANRSPSQFPGTREFWVKYANFSTSDRPVNPRKPLENAVFKGFSIQK